MAKIYNPDQVNKDLQKEKKLIEIKKRLTNDPDWQTHAGDHGPGFIPENIWRNISKNSKANTEVKKNGSI